MSHHNAAHTTDEEQTLLALLRQKEDLAHVLREHSEVFIDKPFPTHLTHLMQQNKMTVNRLSALSLLSRSFTYQLCSGIRSPSRDIVVRLALAMKLSEAETQSLLRSAQRGELYPRLRRDAILLHCVIHGKSLYDTDEALTTMGEAPLL